MLIRGAEIDGAALGDVRIADGCVAAIGDLNPEPGENVIEAQGRALFPGLHDHHIHLAAYAVSLAERYGADITVMNVRDASPAASDAGADFPEPVEHWIEAHIPPDSDLRKRFRFTVGYGPAADAILDFAGKSGVDLIVMAVRRLDPIIAAHLPKPDTAYALATQAVCPLLTVGGE